jgi:hypothetical protein
MSPMARNRLSNVNHASGTQAKYDAKTTEVLQTAENPEQGIARTSICDNRKGKK